MQQLTTRQKTGLIFGLYFFCFLVLLCGLFFTSSRLAMVYQIRKDLTLEVGEISNEYLSLEGTFLTFSKDETGETLRDHLFNDNVSAVIYNRYGNPVKDFGPFSQNNPQLLTMIKKALETEKPSLTTLKTNNQTFVTVVTLLKNKGQTFGAIVLGKPVDDLYQVGQLTMLVLIVVGGVSLMGSFGLGYLLSGWAMAPISRMSKVVNRIDLDKLDQRVEVKGNEKDEVVVLAKRFNQMLERLTLMAQKQKDFVANASHELKTPLTKAILSLDLLGEKSPKNKAETERIKADLFALNDLLEQLLFLSKASKLDRIMIKQVNMKVIVQVVMDKYRKELGNKNLKCRLKIPEDLVVNMTSKHLEIVLSNLISNAIKYSPAEKTITIKGYKKEERVFLEISDQGIGIKKADIKHIFERFFRTNEGRKVNKGNGLGLAIVKQVCDLYKVKLEVFSRLSGGTKFVMEFS